MHSVAKFLLFVLTMLLVLACVGVYAIAHAARQFIDEYQNIGVLIALAIGI
ncbi:MAG: hypothetical protein R2715_07265 [Ilumatobacteraceae bacterium]